MTGAGLTAGHDNTAQPTGRDGSHAHVSADDRTSEREKGYRYPVLVDEQYGNAGGYVLRTDPRNLAQALMDHFGSRTPAPVDMVSNEEWSDAVLAAQTAWERASERAGYRAKWIAAITAALPHLSSAPVVGGGVDLAAALAPLIELGEEWVAAGRLRAQTATGSPRSITQDMLMGTSEEAHGKSLLRALRAVLGGGDL